MRCNLTFNRSRRTPRTLRTLRTAWTETDELDRTLEARANRRTAWIQRDGRDHQGRSISKAKEETEEALTSNHWYAIIPARAKIAHHFNKMTSYQSQKLHSGFYGNKRQVSLAAPVVSVLFAALLSGAAWYSMTSTLDDMTQRDCNAGIQKACEALK